MANPAEGILPNGVRTVAVPLLFLVLLLRSGTFWQLRREFRKQRLDCGGPHVESLRRRLRRCAEAVSVSCTIPGFLAWVHCLVTAAPHQILETRSDQNVGGIRESTTAIGDEFFVTWFVSFLQRLHTT